MTIFTVLTVRPFLIFCKFKLNKWNLVEINSLQNETQMVILFKHTYIIYII